MFCPAAWFASATSDSSPTADEVLRSNAAALLLGATACVDPPEPPSLRCPACSGIMLVVERLTRGQLYFHPSLTPAEPRRCSVDSS